MCEVMGQTVRVMSDEQILRTVDIGFARHPIDRAILILAECLPELQAHQLAEISIGQRNRCLLRVAQAMIGPALNGYARCQACNTSLEFSLSIETLLAAGAERESDALSMPFRLTENTYAVDFRLPSSQDLAVIATNQDIDTARNQLIARCIDRTTHNGDDVTPEQLPASLIDRLSQRFRELDPHLDMQCELVCAECDHRWSLAIDVLQFLWAEISRRSKRLLQQVHRLAKAYGWTEQAILDLSPQRRHAYLELVG